VNDRTRALVQRPGRKLHFASIGAGETAWLSVCDRDVPVFGASVTARDDWNAWLAAAETDEGAMCCRCWTPLRLAALALAEVEDVRASIVDTDALETEVRTLRAEVSRWTTAAFDEIRHAVHARGFRR
jgi:hypothetical protein